jgi:hypothetical protein
MNANDTMYDVGSLPGVSGAGWTFPFVGSGGTSGSQSKSRIVKGGPHG